MHEVNTAHDVTEQTLTAPSGDALDHAAKLAHERLMWGTGVNGHGVHWQNLTDEQRDGWREYARDVILAAGPTVTAPSLTWAADQIERDIFEGQPDVEYRADQTAAEAYRDVIELDQRRSASRGATRLRQIVRPHRS